MLPNLSDYFIFCLLRQLGSMFIEKLNVVVKDIGSHADIGSCFISPNIGYPE